MIFSIIRGANTIILHFALCILHLFCSCFAFILEFVEILTTKGGEVVKEFSCKTKIISGVGAIAALDGRCGKNLLVVTDPYFMKNGTAGRVAEFAKAEKVTYFDRVQPDPRVELVAEGTAVLREVGADTVIALGGGSAMDCAKAMVYFAGKQVTFIAIPTTSGSGSEVTDFAILTKDKVKHPLVDARLQPDIAILDSDLLKELPPMLIADTGFDVLSHALEAFVATGASPITDALAQSAFLTALEALYQSYCGEVSVRLSMHLASTMAGLAFNRAGLGLCHALSHSLGGMFHLPHGRLNAILLPEVVAYNASSKYAKLSQGATEKIALRNLRNKLITLRRQLNMPDTLSQAGIILGDHIREIIASTLQDPCCQTNPVPVTAEGVGKILKAVAGYG